MHLRANRHETIGQMQIILSKDVIRHHQIIDILEYQGSTVDVLLFGIEEGAGMVAPVTEGIEMMRSVPAVVEAVTIALE